ncbi:MAG: hypothetical protein ACAH83_13225 [Alphaproteobacteria bacterium]
MADETVPKTDEMPGSGIMEADKTVDTKTPAAPKKTDPKKGDGDEQTPPAPSGDGVDGSQFLSNEVAASLKAALGLKALDPHLEEMLRTAQLRLTKDQTGLLIDLPDNKHSLHCGKTKDGVEFIGMHTKKMIVDEHDAKIMIGLAKARGWVNVNVTGTPAEQDLLWLEAMRHGLKVANHVPDPNSDVAKAWAAEPKPSVTPATEENFHVKTMQLLQEKATAATDKDVKAGLEGALNKFKEGIATGTADTFNQLTEALSDKNEAKAGYNLAVDLLNKAEPKLALAKLEAPVVATTAATNIPAPKNNPAPT